MRTSFLKLTMNQEMSSLAFSIAPETRSSSLFVAASHIRDELKEGARLTWQTRKSFADPVRHLVLGFRAANLHRTGSSSWI